MIVNKSRLAYLLGFNVLLAASSVACGGANGDDGVAPGKQESNLNTAKSCAVDGKTYKTGENFPSPDGCNTCSCSESGVLCSKMACANLTPSGDNGAARTKSTEHRVESPSGGSARKEPSEDRVESSSGGSAPIGRRPGHGERHGRKHGRHHRRHHGSRHGTGPGDARLPETPGPFGSTPAVPGPHGPIPCWPDVVSPGDVWPSTDTTVAGSLGKEAHGKISRTVDLGTTGVAVEEDTADSEGEWYPGVDGVDGGEESVEVPGVSIGWPGESSDEEPTPGSSPPWEEGGETYPWPGDQEATPFPYEPCPRELPETPDVPAVPEPFPPTSCPGTEPGPGIPPHAGSSEPPAMGCALIYAPVCGTDGSTYGNACVAEVLARVTIAYDGECKSR